jgi:hypothetical protein
MSTRTRRSAALLATAAATVAIGVTIATPPSAHQSFQAKDRDTTGHDSGQHDGTADRGGDGAHVDNGLPRGIATHFSVD